MPESLSGLRIRERRRAAGIRQAELAQRMGISPSYLNLIERAKRRAAPEMVARAARALGLEPGALDGALERRLADRLAEIAALPERADLALDPAEAADLVGRHPGWARALARAEDGRRDAARAVAALSDRLTHDPFLSDAVHRMLTRIAAIRSTSEILDGIADIAPAQRRRFHRILAEESAALSEIAESLARFFDRAHAPAEPASPAEAVEEAFLEAGNRFPALEPDLPAEAPAAREARLADLAGGTRAAEEAPDDAPDPHARRRAHAEAAAETLLGPAMDAELAARPTLSGPAERRRARRALREHAADALLMPAAEMQAAGAALRWDLDALARRFEVPFDAVARRLTGLPPPAPRAAWLRVDAAGAVLGRRSLPESPLPRSGAACPLWVVWRALSEPGRTLRQSARFPAGDRAVLVARADPVGVQAWGAPRRIEASLLFLPAAAAADTVYAPEGRETPEPVGPHCRICTRADCPARTEDPITG